MSDNTTAITIKLLDRQFQFKCPPEQAAKLQEAGVYLDGKMRHVQQAGASVGYEKTAVLAAMDVCYELMCLRDNKKDVDENFEQRIKKLQEKITAVIAQSGVNLPHRAVGDQQALEL